jgi:hypothetical protein
VVRVRVVRPKYRKPTAADGGAPIVTAELPERPIPRSVAGPGLIAHVITQKFCDHLPLHRQQVIFRRHGVHLPRSTLGNLVQGGTALLSRVVDSMWQHAREHADWVAIDATGVLVLAAEQCRRGHFWVVVAQRDHVLFRYTPKHNGNVPVELLSGFRGYVIADASSVYHELYRTHLTSPRSHAGRTRGDAGSMRSPSIASAHWSASASLVCSTTHTTRPPIRAPALRTPPSDVRRQSLYCNSCIDGSSSNVRAWSTIRRSPRR